MGPSRFDDSTVETWLTSPDTTAVERAGTNPYALARLVGDRLLMRFQVMPAGRRKAFALSLLAHRRRVAAIHAWADAQGVSRWRAVAHFVDHDPARMVKP